MDDEDGSLQITPSFKQRSKGKARSSAAARTPVESPAASGDERDATKPAGEDDDLDEGNSSAILFRKSTKSGKARASGLGASISSSSSRKPLQAGSSNSSNTTNRSKLNLSFGPNSAAAENAEDDDEDAENSFSSSVVRKNDSSRKLKRPPNLPGLAANGAASDRNLSQSMSQASISPSIAGSTASIAGPSYSKDYLAELKAANTSTPSSLARSGNGTAKYDDLTMSKFGTNGTMAAYDEPGTLLPTENAIASAKARRETARRLGVDNMASSSSDFISLQIGMPTSNRESRLVREEDEIGEGEDEHSAFTGAEERIPLGKKGRAALEKKRKEELRGMIDDVMGEDEENNGMGIDGEDDEEAREWELAQIRRGEQRSTRNGDENGEKAPYRAAPIPEASALPSLLSVSNRLQATLAEARSSKAENDELMAHALREREGLETQESELRNEVERVNTKYEWFVEFKDWIEDVANFLDEKFPKLAKIEADNLSVQRERLDLVAKRRFQDDSDDVASFTGMPVPSSWTTSENKAEEGDDMEVDAEVDEMGRSRRDDVLEPKSYARKTRREERKKRRAQLLQKASGQTPPVDGYGTDDALLTSDSQDLLAAKEAMSSDLTALFSDVQAEEFRDPSLGIRPRFEDWKHRYGEEYGNAFAGLAMVGVWEFWARCELATWNPFGIRELEAPPTGMDNFRWHQALSAFQHARATSAGMDGEEHFNPEDDVVNGMVTTVYVPQLRKLAVDAYDPYSSIATSKALAVMEEITYCLETSHPRFEFLILGFISRFQVAISRLQSLVQPYLKQIRSPSGASDIESIEARNRFSQRCSKLLHNALRWRKYTKGLLLPAGVDAEGIGAGRTLEVALATELVAKVMLPVLEAGWETGGSDIARTVVSSLPANSLPADLVKRLTRP